MPARRRYWRNIERFTFCKGISLCFIGAVGYAAIQESFEEAVCIKITPRADGERGYRAPLLEPLVGAAWVHVLRTVGGDVYFICRTGYAITRFFGLQRNASGGATRRGETLHHFKALGL